MSNNDQLTPTMIPITVPWLAEVFPDGFAPGKPIVITGPGGSGKPLIGHAFIASWIAAGGGIVFLSLQYPDPTFILESYRRVIGDDLDTYRDRVAFIALDPTIERIGTPTANRFAANVVIPDTMTEAIARGRELVSPALSTGGPRVLVFASALNLLMFSPTWRERITERAIAIMKDPTLTCVFSVSEKPHEELIHRITDAADTVIYSERSSSEFTLVMRVLRSGARFASDAVTIPIPEEELRATREIADGSRKKIIPAISAM
ncbi:MAG: ATPase domain-containing protein [Alkalispirochaeta sp.]